MNTAIRDRGQWGVKLKQVSDPVEKYGDKLGKVIDKVNRAANDSNKNTIKKARNIIIDRSDGDPLITFTKHHRKNKGKDKEISLGKIKRRSR